MESFYTGTKVTCWICYYFLPEFVVMLLIAFFPHIADSLYYFIWSMEAWWFWICSFCWPDVWWFKCHSTVSLCSEWNLFRVPTVYIHSFIVSPRLIGIYRCLISVKNVLVLFFHAFLHVALFLLYMFFMNYRAFPPRESKPIMCLELLYNIFYVILLDLAGTLKIQYYHFNLLWTTLPLSWLGAKHFQSSALLICSVADVLHIIWLLRSPFWIVTTMLRW